MKAISIISTVLLLYAPTAHADTFGSGANTFDLEFVSIGNPDNPGDTPRTYAIGKVEYAYRIGKFEIAEHMIDKAIANTQSERNPLRITHRGRGASRPATGLNWFEAAKFVNWLNTSTGHTPAYKFIGSTFALWHSGDTGYDPANAFRNSGAFYFLPGADEWYKAAYYDPTAGVYYDYATGTDSVPDEIDFPGDTTFDVVFYDGGSNPHPNVITDEGVLSPYGTAGQTGNAWEWEETELDGVNDSRSSARKLSGASWNNTIDALHSSVRWGDDPFNEGQNFGLRVASFIPEPMLPSDYNEDGVVNAADYVVWRDHNGMAFELPNRDASLTGNVGQVDYEFWVANYGSTTNTGNATAVPEPASWLPVTAALALAWCGRRRSAQ